MKSATVEAMPEEVPTEREHGQGAKGPSTPRASEGVGCRLFLLRGDGMVSRSRTLGVRFLSEDSLSPFFLCSNSWTFEAT